MEVHLLVRSGGVRNIPRVSVYGIDGLDDAVVPDGDAIILNADSNEGDRFAELSDRKGKKYFYFQGYGIPGSEVVKQNLVRGIEIIASSKWLEYEAKRYGADSHYFPYGIDRSIFSYDPPENHDTKMISMMTHHLEWKGTVDGMEAIEIVKDYMPEVKVYLFGVSRQDCSPDWCFIDSPTRSEIGSLLQTSTVFVCSSWEEGFGLPGLEALACGAALATTDTKGSRDYAIDGKTALVSPIQDPRALAENILTLLRNRTLRKELVGNGKELVDSQYRSWLEASQKIRDFLVHNVKGRS
jgi:glycosyltransferase involved in cell wall biosynthesis